MFTQLVLIITLALVGTTVLAIAIGRDAITGPAASQFLRSMNAFADVAEELARSESREAAAAHLRDAGLIVRDAPPPPLELRRAPILSAIFELAPQRLAPGREIRIGGTEGERLMWLKLDTEPALWVSFAFERDRRGAFRFSVPMLMAGAVLVLIAAAYGARRLAAPLRRLARAAPSIVRGEPPRRGATGGPVEVEELALALGAAGRELREAAEERTVMLAGISHDLRTPLTRLQYAIELLPGSDPELRAGMHRDIAEIDAILKQFITYARDGRDEAVAPLDLSALCRNVAGALGDAWRLDLPRYAPATGRPMALLRAVENLVVNAERHGAPPFALRLSRDEACWRIEVSDHGPGLPGSPERMRQPFVHGEGGGTGLGLAIVDRVVRQHGGELVLSSRSPHGLVATILLPER
ncbi:ATP-binding protein [Lysobacter soli]|uniref:ATP-binding protein n=1 Tax=Lysobacter soli TaxID=453783 RepID=UPI0024109FC2|nr:ATP-binding protein [Lysobacter soli]MDG2517142.1 ATP-binding protein [Lysobacter soli]